MFRLFYDLFFYLLFHRLSLKTETGWTVTLRSLQRSAEWNRGTSVLFETDKSEGNRWAYWVHLSTSSWVNFHSCQQGVVTHYLLIKVSLIPLLLFTLPCVWSMLSEKCFIAIVFFIYVLLEAETLFLTVSVVFSLHDLFYRCCESGHVLQGQIKLFWTELKHAPCPWSRSWFQCDVRESRLWLKLGCKTSFHTQPSTLSQVMNSNLNLLSWPVTHQDEDPSETECDTTWLSHSSVCGLGLWFFKGDDELRCLGDSPWLKLPNTMTADTVSR